jgi:hypothetical protein
LWPIICKLLRIAPWGASADTLLIVTAAIIVLSLEIMDIFFRIV